MASIIKPFLRLMITLFVVIALTGAPLSAQAFIPSPVFNPCISYPMSGARAVGAGIGDFNSDGLKDVAVSNAGTGASLWIFLQQSDETLNHTAVYSTDSRPETIAVGDFNGDGRDDVVVGNFSSNTIGVFLQTSEGELAQQVTYAVSSGPDALVADDLNNDGLTDLAVSHHNASVIGVFYQQDDGTLGTMVSLPSQQAGWDDIDTGDFNNDGLTDIVKMNGQYYLNATLLIYLQTESGFAAPVPHGRVDAIHGSGMAAGDLTGDGLDDIAVGYGGNAASITIFAQTEEGVLVQQDTYEAYDIPTPMETADLDQDGRLELIVGHSGWEAVTVFFQRPNAKLAPYQLYSIPGSTLHPQALDVGDVNNDGLIDAVVANKNGHLDVLTNRLTPDFRIFTDPQSLNVEPGLVKQISVNLDTLLDFNGPVTYSVSGLRQGVNYSFSANPVTAPDSATLYLFASSTAPLGYDPFTIIGTSGNLTRSVNVGFNIIQRIEGLTATASTPTLLGSATHFQTSTTSGSSINYTWDFGDGNTGTGIGPWHTYSTVGQYTVTVTASNAINSMHTTLTVDVVDVPVSGLEVVAVVSDEPGFSVDLYAFIDSGTNVQYAWDFGDGATGSGPVVSHTYPASQKYTLRITATNGQGNVTRTYHISPGSLEDPNYPVFLPMMIRSE